MGEKCLHCGAPIPGNTDESAFCCKGCEYVHGLIQEQGFGHYYELKDRPVAPVGSVAFEQRDYTDIDELWKGKEPGVDGVSVVELRLRGISCVGCVWLVEKLFTMRAGSVRIDLDPQTGKVRIGGIQDVFDLGGFAAEIQRYGYVLGLPERGDEASIKGSDGPGRRIGVCAFLAMNTMLFVLPFYFGMAHDDPLAPLLRLLAATLGSFSVLYGGSYFLMRSIKALRVGVLHMDLPISIGLVVAWIGSMLGWALGRKDLFYFDFVAVFTLLMLVGRWVQEWVTERNQSLALRAQPANWVFDRVGSDEASVLEEGEKVRVGEMKPGVRFRVPRGETVPVRCRLRSHAGTFSLESINGESDPRTVQHGGLVSGGAVVLGQEPVVLEAMETWENSLLKRLHSIESREGDRNRLMERVLRFYIVAVVAVALCGMLFWAWVLGDWVKALQVAVSVMVVSCPCAIGLAYPRLNDRVASLLKERGIFLRTHNLWARLAMVRHVVFDKTGTLTLETLDWLNETWLDDAPEQDLKALYLLVETNLHPVGRTIRESMLVRFPEWAKGLGYSVEVYETIGLGVACRIDGREYYLGQVLGEEALSGSGEARETGFRRDGEVIGLFRFADAVREDAPESVRELESMGKKVWVLSGDVMPKVSALLAALGLQQERGFGECSPQDKARWIRENTASRGMMIGDGVNDALAFEQALCRATPVIGRGLLENHADFYFLGRGIQGIVSLFVIARSRGSILRELMAITLVYNLIVISVALCGAMNPLLAAVLMPLSSVFTVSWASLRRMTLA